MLGREQPHAGRVGEALLARAGVGVAGVDDDGPQVGAVAGLAREAHRRGGGGVAREGRRRDAGTSDTSDAEVELALLLHAGGHAGGDEPLGVRHAALRPAWACGGSVREARRGQHVTPALRARAGRA